jgi:hypothetical protein
MGRLQDICADALQAAGTAPVALTSNSAAAPAIRQLILIDRPPSRSSIGRRREAQSAAVAKLNRPPSRSSIARPSRS